MSTVTPATVAQAVSPCIRDADGLREFFRLIRQPNHWLLGQYLLASHQISKEQLQQALDWQAQHPGQHLGEILEAKGWLTAEAVQRALHTLMGVPNVRLADFALEPEVTHLLSAELAHRYRVVPVMVLDNSLVLAAEQILDGEALQSLHFYVRTPILQVLAEPDEIQQALFTVYEEGEWPEQYLGNGEPEADEEQVWREAERQAKQKPTVRLVNSFIEDAIRRQASDIHLRPCADRVELLYRLQGTLVTIKVLQRQWLPPLVSRIKVISRLNIAERRLPQDGHARFAFQGQRIDLRISIIPTYYGESVVIRILNKSAGLRVIGEIGFSPEDEAMFLDMVSRSTGILLVTGPTGSGKTTTLYAALQEIRKEPVNVVTVEDPVEYELPGMRQIQLLDAAGFGFPQTLRHILRHDPDVIMIGEMRDEETCKIALESALTGHLVLSTLHTNDAPGAILRLLEIGIAPSLIKSTLIGVLGQRLARLNCPHCKAVEAVTPLRRRLLGLKDEEVFWRSTGCEQCHHTGYAGRVAIYELFALNDAVRDAIRADITSGEMRELAIASGMRPLMNHGLAFARAGRCSLDEVYRACQ